MDAISPDDSQVEVFTLSALEDFKCLGGDCPRTCCTENWRIGVDEETLRLWRSDESAKTKLFSMVAEVKENDVQMRKDGSKSCVALNETGLCSIQTEFGSNFLPQICQDYPRVSIENQYRLYKTANFSCPEITNKVLFRKHQDVFSHQVNSSGSLSDSNLPNNYASLAKAMDDFFLNLIEQSKFPVHVILVYLADSFADIIEVSESKATALEYVKKYNENMMPYCEEIFTAAKQGKFKPDPVTAGSFWKVIYDFCLTRNIDEKYLKIESSLIFGNLKNPAKTHEAFNKIYYGIAQTRKKFRKYFKLKYDSFIRAYLKVYFINRGFPLAPLHVAYDYALVHCMVNICVLQLLLWIQFDKEGRISEKFLAECIVEVDRRLAHSGAVVEYLQKDPHMLQIHRYSQCFLDLF